MRTLVGLIGAFTIITWGCVTAPTGRSQLILLSEEEELQMGVEAYREILKTAAVVSAGPDMTRVKAVGKRIAAVTGKDYEWEFNVVDDPKVINAFCLPGGKVVVYTGLLTLAATDDELAVVVGHEIAHATIRHGAERVSQNLIVGLGVSAAELIIGGEDTETKKLAMAALGLGTQVGVLLPYSRKHETEADEEGLRYMWRAGYDPEAAVTFWEKMAAAGGSGTPEFLSTHPASDTRIDNLRRMAAELKQQKRT